MRNTYEFNPGHTGDATIVIRADKSVFDEVGGKAVVEFYNETEDTIKLPQEQIDRMSAMQQSPFGGLIAAHAPILDADGNAIRITRTTVAKYVMGDRAFVRLIETADRCNCDDTIRMLYTAACLACGHTRTEKNNA